MSMRSATFVVCFIGLVGALSAARNATGQGCSDNNCQSALCFEFGDRYLKPSGGADCKRDWYDIGSIGKACQNAPSIPVDLDEIMGATCLGTGSCSGRNFCTGCSAVVIRMAVGTVTCCSGCGNSGNSNMQ